ncbi:TerD family protein [Cytophagaceae bacterium DM2B3-1]|uniref:TerD family protein n=1 Tax=Xanthocytophaga flava TaxID=3048013 RepID=A0ABT7CJR4_9BACT|nr:TerD family protein [Xanthocytophaga flavus]MDJ1469504.1 TerD family protein [Xanthocytophaga flavus]MDJ1493983.1 TerD family protein [Xanthocytophaga flavus]
MINLKKNSQISLEKNGEDFKHICIGLDWGVINKKSFFGLFNDKESVDLDGSVTMFDTKKKEKDTVYYRKLVSNDKAIRHSGDDRVGDSSADNKDNEVIYIDLQKVSADVDTIVFYLNSFKQQDFSDIPYSKIRIIEGEHHNPNKVFASYDLSGDSSFKGFTSMVMAKMNRAPGGRWTFTAIGEPIEAKDIAGTIKVIREKYL